VVKSKQASKVANYDLIHLSVSHPHNLLPIGIKVQGGVELTDDLIIPVVLEAHHLSHLVLITCSLDFVEDGVMPSSHQSQLTHLFATTSFFA
jgi:hypothetical protein